MKTVEVVVTVLMRDEEGRRTGAAAVTPTFGVGVLFLDIDTIAEDIGIAVAAFLQRTSMEGSLS